jgi:hypothetical protein
MEEDITKKPYILIHYDYKYKVRKLDRKALIITEGYHDIGVEGNTYPIKEFLKKKGFKWSWKNERWYKFEGYDDNYEEEAVKLAKELYKLTGRPVFISAIPWKWGEHVIQHKEELKQVIKQIKEAEKRKKTKKA